MRGLLGADGYLAAALGTALLLAKHSRPRTDLPAGLAPQAFHHCPRCNQVRAHLIHGSDFRRCDTCNCLTCPGDDR